MSEEYDPEPTPSKFCHCSSRTSEDCICDQTEADEWEAWEERKRDKAKEQQQAFEDAHLEDGQTEEESWEDNNP
jgi:hypothetical protein